MPTKKSVVPPEIYRLRVTLLGTSLPIWRRLVVPAHAEGGKLLRGLAHQLQFAGVERASAKGQEFRQAF